MRPATEAYSIIRKELEGYSPVLAAKPEIVVATKLDATGAKAGAKALQKRLKGVPVLGVSAATGEGVQDLVRELFRALHSPDGID
jgi:GTP-binding protein